MAFTSFNPRPRTGGRQRGLELLAGHLVFQSTPPHGGATDPDLVGHPVRLVSIHAPARGGDLRGTGSTSRCSCFNPRPRTGGRPTRWASRRTGGRFQSTPPHGGATGKDLHKWHERVVSIHAPARGGDLCPFGPKPPRACFNPRPRTGGRPGSSIGRMSSYEFQSTPPHGGATQDPVRHHRHILVSIHAPARGGDRQTRLRGAVIGRFQSTPPHGGATRRTRASSRRIKFQSTPPHGGRPLTGKKKRTFNVVSIHAPARGGDAGWRLERDGGDVSIHAPARGGDLFRFGYCAICALFQSTPPHGGATM